MQNNNVSGTITAISGITSRADNNTNDNNNNTAGRQESEQQQSTVQAHGGGMQRYEVSTVQHDGIDAGDEALTARAGHFPLDGQSKDEPTYDRLEVNPLGLHLRSDASDVTRGRGVFSDRRIPAGTLIEEAPVLIITKGQWEEGKMDDCILGEYGFCWSGGGQGIGLGLASLFNHSSSPNVNFIRQPATSTIRFITSRTVEAGDELCICYSADESKLWFTPSGRASPAPSETSSQDEFPSLTSDDLFDADQMAERARRSAARAERKRQVALSDQAKARSTKRTALRDQVLQPIPTYPSAETNELELGTSLRADSASPAPSSTSSFPVYPTPAERPSSDLPLPLHSNGDAQEDPVDVCAALDWSEEAWAGLSQADVPDWGAAVRVKGTAELEEEAEDAALMEVWAVAVQAQRDTRLVLEFVRDQLPVEQATRHLKKVARRVDPDLHPDGSVEEAVTMVVLCSTTIMASQELCTALAAYHPSLAGLRPVRKIVPASPARTQEQLLIKSPMWPVTFAASLIRPGTSSDWTAARAAWVHAGILRSVAIALDAKKLGDLPVGVFCVSPPESLWPVIDGFIPPTADLRASGHDTRLTTGHPLKHASFNCIRNIANLRTQKPYSNMLPTRNGADYLLTSLSLFVTHEPCPMCCMALLHSRVREVFYVFPSKRGGGFESAFGVHGRKDLNHRFEVWRYEGKEVERWREELKVGDEYAL